MFHENVGGMTSVSPNSQVCHVKHYLPRPAKFASFETLVRHMLGGWRQHTGSGITRNLNVQSPYRECTPAIQSSRFSKSGQGSRLEVWTGQILINQVSGAAFEIVGCKRLGVWMSFVWWSSGQPSFVSVCTGGRWRNAASLTRSAASAETDDHRRTFRAPAHCAETWQGVIVESCGPQSIEIGTTSLESLKSTQKHQMHHMGS